MKPHKKKWFNKYGFFLNKEDFYKVNYEDGGSVVGQGANMKAVHKEGAGWEPTNAEVASELTSVRMWLLQL